jgi:protein-S-isoprenylcysteine O-methyltransferase Ste14
VVKPAIRRLVLTMSTFALAAGANTASVAVEQRWSLLTRWLGRRGWYVHLGIVVPLWALFLALVPGLGRYVSWPISGRLRPLGTVLLGAAALLWLLAYRQLGGARTANGNIFGHGSRARVDGGVFRILRNPMYDSYALALAGLALRRGNSVYLLLAAESFLLLNQVEARVENRLLGESRPERGKHEKSINPPSGLTRRPE